MLERDNNSGYFSISGISKGAVILSSARYDAMNKELTKVKNQNSELNEKNQELREKLLALSEKVTDMALANAKAAEADAETRKFFTDALKSAQVTEFNRGVAVGMLSRLGCEYPQARELFKLFTIWYGNMCDTGKIDELEDLTRSMTMNPVVEGRLKQLITQSDDYEFYSADSDEPLG